MSDVPVIEIADDVVQNIASKDNTNFLNKAGKGISYVWSLITTSPQEINTTGICTLDEDNIGTKSKVIV